MRYFLTVILILSTGIGCDDIASELGAKPEKVRIVQVNPGTPNADCSTLLVMCHEHTVLELEDGTRFLAAGNWGKPGEEFLINETTREWGR